MPQSAVSGVNYVNGNFYRTKVVDNGDGTFGSTVFRTDAQGNNEVPIAGYGAVDGVPLAQEINTVNATAEEQRLLSDPNSILNQTRQQQTQSLEGNFFPTVGTPDQQTALAQAGGGSGNTASVVGTPDQQTGSTPISQQQPQQESTAVLKYPLKMKDDQDRIMFHAHEYKSGGRLTGGNFGELTPVQYIPLGQRILLPIQSSITDQNAVGWEPDTLNPIESEAAKLSESMMKSSSALQLGEAVARKYNEALTAAKSTGIGGEAVRTYLIGQAIGVNNLLSRLQGQVLNPNLELLFQGPQLRPFSFTFKLSPRSLEEAKIVKEIIKYFKKNMAVKKDNAVFLKAPNVFKIQYQYGKDKAKVHPGLNLIKMCALTNCSVDYTPNGTYMTYPEGTMVSYSISLSFQELTPIYQDDYDEFKYGDGSVVAKNDIGIGA